MSTMTKRATALLLLCLLCLSQAQNIPHLKADCSSTLIQDGSSVELTPAVSLHWAINATALRVILQRDRKNSWIALGFSSDGKMNGSKAVIGLPKDKKNPPFLYSLKNQGYSKLDEPGVLSDAAVKQKHGLTMLHFTVALDTNVLPISRKGHTILLYAVGASDALDYHEHRGAFSIDLSQCKSKTPKHDPLTLFAIHGLFATLALGLALPIAVTTAWFRQLMPSCWIYLHVGGHLMAVLLCIVAIGTAVGAMAQHKQEDDTASSHMSKAHHWIGVILLVAIIFQVLNGFRRPNVDPKPPDTVYNIEPPRSKILGIAPAPKTAREKWHWIHRLVAWTILVLALYQLFSGLSLYSNKYNKDMRVTISIFWVYLGVLAVILGILKVYLILLERRTQRARRIMSMGEEEMHLKDVSELSRTVVTPMHVNVI